MVFFIPRAYKSDEPDRLPDCRPSGSWTETASGKCRMSANQKCAGINGYLGGDEKRTLSPQQSNNLRHPSQRLSPSFSRCGNTICAWIVPVGKPCPKGEDIHAKRKRDSSRAATRARCLGVQMARTGRRRQKKASQNSSRIGRTVGRRSSCS